MVLTGASSNFSKLVRRLAKVAPRVLAGETRAPEGSRTKQLQRHLTEVRTHQLVADYKAGATMRALAKTYGVHRGTVAGHLRRAGVELRAKGLVESQVDDAVQLYAEGWSLVRIAERLGCDGETVRTDLKRKDIQMRKPWER